MLTNSGAAADPQSLALALAETALELDPPAPAEWRPDEGAPADVAPLLGVWWSEGEEFVFRWRAGRLEARARGCPRGGRSAVFEREADDLWRTVSGRERGEALRVVRDEQGRVAKLYWATYPLTREQRPFGEAEARGSRRHSSGRACGSEPQAPVVGLARRISSRSCRASCAGTVLRASHVPS